MFGLKTLAVLAIGVAFGVMGCAPQGSSSVEAKTSQAKVKVTPAPKAGIKTAPEKKLGAAETKPAPAARVVKEWDFAQLNPDAWTDLSLPGNSRVKGKNGARFTQYRNGIGPHILKLDLDATQVTTVRMELSAQRTKDGKNATPVKLTAVRAFWVGPDEIKNDRPEFAGERSVKMEQRSSASPNEWTASLRAVPTWKGKVAQLAFRLDVPEQLKAGGDDRYLLAVKKIELLK